MTQIMGNNRVNPDPCTPEMANNNDVVLQTQVDNLTTIVNNSIVGASDHKVSIDSTDEMGSGFDYLFAKLAHHDTITGDDRLCRTQNNGDGTVSYFVKVDDLGMGSDNFTFSVKSDGSDSPGYGIDKVSPVTAPTGGDPQVYWAESGGKLTAYVAASDVVALGGSGPTYTAGCGISLSGGAFSFNAGSVAGVGLGTSGTCGLKVVPNNTIKTVTGITLAVTGGNLVVTLAYQLIDVYGVLGSTATLTGSTPVTTTCP